MATAPQTAMDMPQEAAPNPFSDPNTMAVYDQMRQTVSPKEFSDEMLAGASQIDPQAMAQFRDELSQIDLSPEDLDMLNNMVDEILANPERYAEVRAKYIEMGTPEELLPEQFDPQFFAAMNMAIEQLIGEPAGVQAFAQGGIAELKPIAKAIASYGRNGDTMLAHITPAEARMLRRRGGSGTINPATGLPEFFLKKAFKSLGKAIKSFASSTVGKIVTTVALGFFLGPAAASLVGASSVAGVAAVSGFVGSAGATLLGGGNLKDALKAGAIGGLTAGAGAGVMGGSEAFQTGSYTGPTTVSGQVDKFSKMISPSAAAPAPAAAPSAIDASGNVKGLAPTEPVFQSGQNLPQAQTFPVGDSMGAAAPLPGQPGSDVLVGGKPSITTLGTTQAPYSPLEMTGTPSKPFSEYFGTQPSAAAANPMDATEFQGSLAKPQGVAPPSAYKVPTIGESFSKMGEGIGMGDGPASYKTFMEGAGDLFAPGPDNAQITARAREIMSTTPGASLKDAMAAASKELSPGILRTYGPAAVAGIATLGAAGGFKPTPAAESTLKPELMKPVTQRIAEGGNQRNYYIQGLPGVKYDQYGAPIFGQNVPLPTFDTGLGITSLMNPKGYAEGGSIAVGYADGGSVTAANFDSAAYLKAYPDAAAALARGDFPDAYSHYLQTERLGEKRTATKILTTPEQKAAAQAANRKAVADAKTAKKAAGFTGAYQNINAGLSYDAPAGIAATAIAARQAAFKPTMDKFTQAQATNAATLAKPYTPTVVDQPYNNTKGYENVLNPVAPPINYDTTPVGTTQPPVTVTQPPVDDRPITTMPIPAYTGRAINDQEVMDWLKANPNATDRDIVRTMDYYKVNPEQVARVTGMQGVDPSSVQNIDRRYNMAKLANEGTNAFAVARQNQADAVTGQSIRDYFAKNPGMTDKQIANYMDQNSIDPAQMQYAFAGTPGAIGSGDVLARYQAATKLPAMVAGSPQEQAAVADGQALLQRTLAAQQPPTTQTKLLNMGGIASLGSGGYPRRTGQISGPGTATSDSIPAMLSDGEFVMTAKAVRGAGKGDRRAGAKRMYALMNQLEKNAARG